MIEKCLPKVVITLLEISHVRILFLVSYTFCSSGQSLLRFNFYLIFFKISKLTDSESRGQEEAACVRLVNTTTGGLFTGTNAVKFPSTVTWSSCALPLSD